MPDSMQPVRFRFWFWLIKLVGVIVFGISATDPKTFALVPLLLMTVAFAACWIPARRATKVDPMTALRYE